MRFLTVLSTGLLLLGSTAASAQQRGGSGFCLAYDDQARIYYHSDTFQTDQAMTTEQYQASFAQALKAQGKPLAPDCKFTDLPNNIPVYLNGLRQQCSDCSISTLQRLAWTPAAPTPAQAAAPGAGYQTKANALAGQAACAGFTEANYRTRALSGEPDTQLKAMCGQAFEYYSMYKRAIAQGYSESDANRTYAAHEGAARNVVSFYNNNRAD